MLLRQLAASGRERERERERERALFGIRRLIEVMEKVPRSARVCVCVCVCVHCAMHAPGLLRRLGEEI